MARVIGLDIGSFSIKAVHLSKKSGGFQLESIGIVLNPLGQRPGEDEASKNKLAEVVRKLLSDVKLSGSKAVLSLAESQVYNRVVEMPMLSDSELASAIKWEAEQYIPIPIDQVNIDYEVISRPAKDSPSNKMQVFLVAASKRAIENITDFSDRCGLEVVGLETEMIAVIRAMVTGDNPEMTSMVLHLGANSSTLSLLKGGMSLLTHSMETGGVALTRVLSSELGIEYSQAEEYKRSYGLDVSQLEGRVAASMQPIIDRILSEVRKAMQNYNVSNQQAPINRVVLSGGTSLLPGLVAHVAQFLGVEVVLGNCFLNTQPSKTAAIPNDSVSFSTAVGLAMREL